MEYRVKCNKPRIIKYLEENSAKSFGRAQNSWVNNRTYSTNHKRSN